MSCNCQMREVDGVPAPYRCAWQVRRTLDISGKDLCDGDLLRLPRTLTYSRVNQVENKISAEWLHVWLDIDPHGKALMIGTTEPVMVMRNGHCEAPCCDRCSWEVAEGVRYCRAHWDAAERQDAIDQRVEVEANHG